MLTIKSYMFIMRNIVWDTKSFSLCGSLKEILECQLIIYPSQTVATSSAFAQALMGGPQVVCCTGLRQAFEK